MLWRGDFVLFGRRNEETEGKITDGKSSLPQADGGTPSLLFSKPDGEDAEEADNDAENRHGAVAFAEADGRI